MNGLANRRKPLVLVGSRSHEGHKAAGGEQRESGLSPVGSPEGYGDPAGVEDDDPHPVLLLWHGQMHGAAGPHFLQKPLQRL